MRDILLKLRAALTPQALLVLALALLLSMSFAQKEDSRTALERRTEQALAAISGAGQVKVVIRMRETSRQTGLAAAASEKAPCGAVAVAQGADDPWVQIQLQEALCALLGLPASAVSVAAGGE